MAVQILTDNDFQSTISSTERAIIKYHADWCGSCRLISPKFKKLSEDERFKGVKFYEVNAEENPEARKWAGVKNLPFFATVKTGAIVAADCVAKEEKIVEFLNELNAR